MPKCASLCSITGPLHALEWSHEMLPPGKSLCRFIKSRCHNGITHCACCISWHADVFFAQCPSPASCQLPAASVNIRQRARNGQRKHVYFVYHNVAQSLVVVIASQQTFYASIEWFNHHKVILFLSFRSHSIFGLLPSCWLSELQ